MLGHLSKMQADLDGETVRYTLNLNEPVALNPLLGKPLRFEFLGEMQCVGCGRAIKKTFQQGYCFPCVKTKAACDLCIVKPERCHYHLGTCREPEWGQAHCMQKHVVYLANTSGLKVGITRLQNIPKRFIDQGAVQALPLFEVESRYHSGLIEVSIAKHLNDKTNWRKMLQGAPELLDLSLEKEKLRETLLQEVDTLVHRHEIKLQPAAHPHISLQYPIQKYPDKLISLSFDKTPVIEGVLEGVKGQYLMLSTGVLNIRNFSGYAVRLSC